MIDLGFVLVLLAFFALASLLVSGCERIVGGDEAGGYAVVEPKDAEELAA